MFELYCSYEQEKVENNGCNITKTLCLTINLSLLADFLPYSISYQLNPYVNIYTLW